MPTPTFMLIQEQTVGASTATVTFSSIPSTYSDLILEFVGGKSLNSFQMLLRLNGDTGGNYSYLSMYNAGSGTITYSGVRSQNNTFIAQTTVGWGTTSNLSLEFQIMQYKNANVWKNVFCRGSSAQIATSDTKTVLAYGTWRNTAAVTSVSLTAESGTISAGSVFRLWGI